MSTQHDGTTPTSAPAAGNGSPRLDPEQFGDSPPHAPISDLLGLTYGKLGGGEGTVFLDVEERHANPMGTVHGGVLCDLTDAAMGMALASTLKTGESFTTLELKTNFLRPFWQGRLEARARIRHRGRTVAMIEAEVLDSAGRAIAHSSSTCMILRGEKAAGR